MGCPLMPLHVLPIHATTGWLRDLAFQRDFLGWKPSAFLKKKKPFARSSPVHHDIQCPLLPSALIMLLLSRDRTRDIAISDLHIAWGKIEKKKKAL